MPQKIIIDVGAHKGEDSDFYLKKGYKVIGIEASRKLFDLINLNFINHPCKQNYTLLNYAVTDKDDDEITLYENENSLWSTIFETWDQRNKSLGAGSVKGVVKTIRLDTLINRELGSGGEIEYIKIDIEGADTLALKSLSNVKQQPKYISIESEKKSWPKLLEEFSIFERLGYTKFKVVDQSNIYKQSSSYLSEKGEKLEYNFNYDSSGPFGDELPGEWISKEQAIQQYKKIFRRYKYFGDSGIFNNKFVMKNTLVKKLMHFFKIKFPQAGWYDTHATF